MLSIVSGLIVVAFGAFIMYMGGKSGGLVFGGFFVLNGGFMVFTGLWSEFAGFGSRPYYTKKYLEHPEEMLAKLLLRKKKGFKPGGPNLGIWLATLGLGITGGVIYQMIVSGFKNTMKVLGDSDSVGIAEYLGLLLLFGIFTPMGIAGLFLIISPIQDYFQERGEHPDEHPLVRALKWREHGVVVRIYERGKTGLNFGLNDTSLYSVQIKSKPHREAVLHYARERAPGAVVGYSEENARLFEKNPASLLAKGGKKGTR